jgi:hypothetical protein
MKRRKFIKKASLSTVAVAVGSTILGCKEANGN